MSWLCRIGWHKWGPWSTQHCLDGDYNPYIRHHRICQRCYTERVVRRYAGRPGAGRRS